MDLFEALKRLGLVTFSKPVSDFLGVFAGPLAILLNAVAIGVVFVTVIRIVAIVMSSLNAFNEDKEGEAGGEENSQDVLRGALTSMLMTLALSLFAFIAVTQGVNILYNFATGFSNDAVGAVKVNAIEEWFGKGSIFAVIMLQVQSIAKILVVLAGGVILARTLFRALSGSKYEAEDKNQYDRVQNALKRAFIVGLITVFGFFAVQEGPNQIYSLLKSFQSAAELTPGGGGGAPITTPPPNGGATPAPTVVPTPPSVTPPPPPPPPTTTPPSP